MTIGNRLKELRNQCNFTQEQLEDYLNLSQGHLSKIENGKRNLNLTLLDKLCAVYNCSPEYILGTSDEHSEPKIAFRCKSGVDLETIATINKIINNLKLLRKLDKED